MMVETTSEVNESCFVHHNQYLFLKRFSGQPLNETWFVIKFVGKPDNIRDHPHNIQNYKPKAHLNIVILAVIRNLFQTITIL